MEDERFINYLARKRQECLDAAGALADQADADGGRGMTKQEHEQAAKYLDEAADWLLQIEGEKEKQDLRDRIGKSDQAQMGVVDGAGQEVIRQRPRGKSAGHAFVESAIFKNAQAKKRASGSLGQGFTAPAVLIEDWGVKQILESTETEYFSAFRTLLGQLETPGFVQPRLTIADLMSSIPITVGNAATYPIVDSRTPPSGSGSGVFTDEGADKKDVAYSFDVVTKTLRKITAFLKVSEEFLEDAPGLVAYINADMPLMVRQAEESYLAAALYAAVTATGTQAGVGGDNGFDAVLDGITTVQVAGFEPDALVITPGDWASLRVDKFTSDGYVGGGPFSPTGNPWGVRVVVTQSATTGTPLVGAFRQGAKVYRKGGLSLQMTNSNEDDFKKNLVALRCEERMILGVTYPEAFAEVTLGS